MRRRTMIRNTMMTGAVSLGSSLQLLAETFPVDEVTMPAFFIGHGSPMNAIEDNAFTQGWKGAVADTPRPKAIVCISAHWLTRGTHVTSMPWPKTIHDFGGFPKRLFDVEYKAPGDPALADEVRTSVKGTKIQRDQDWGLDHGTWSVLKPIFPKADIPVIQLSIDIDKPGAWHYELAKELRGLRTRGIMIVGSGNMVHNLRMIDFGRQDTGFDWAMEMNELFKKQIHTGDHLPLLEYKSLGKSATLAIPTPDHYYPLLYTLALQTKEEQASIFNDQATMGSLTMTSVKLHGT